MQKTQILQEINSEITELYRQANAQVNCLDTVGTDLLIAKKVREAYLKCQNIVLNWQLKKDNAVVFVIFYNDGSIKVAIGETFKEACESEELNWDCRNINYYVNLGLERSGFQKEDYEREGIKEAKRLGISVPQGIGDKLEVHLEYQTEISRGK